MASTGEHGGQGVKWILTRAPQGIKPLAGQVTDETGRVKMDSTPALNAWEGFTGCGHLDVF